ncbi:amidase signature enzyme [Coprinopsis marcescibilis]|uniref:Amidase signature enzyme n=1 Tax=Coprinopsis marcescibilis TaxID=230819 RepID=A0A5C3KSF9_COPMA|nr:amidase signature enzyme [Coprinopsis marcescibilis]
MIFSFSPSAHQRACAWKQKERQSRIASAAEALYASSPHSLQLTQQEESKLHALSLSDIVSQCRTGTIAPSDVMKVYGKKCLQAQEATNCLSDVMFEESLRTPAVSSWGPGGDTVETGSNERSLLGVPVSIKDTVDIEGHDSTIGYSRNIGRPASSSSAIVRLLQDAGALVLAKTTAPAGLIGLETQSHVFGVTRNPHNTAFTPAGSSGGGAALLASGGSKIDIGSDIGGSVRIPAHFCGVWSLKGSAGRFPNWGNRTSMRGLEGVPIVSSPMAGTLDDLEAFWKRVVGARPWMYDHTCLPIPWRPVDLQQEGRKLKWGIMWDDATIPSTPACRRALATVANALRSQGHEVVDFSPPNLAEGLQIGYKLLFSDGGKQIASQLHPSGEEAISPAAKGILSLFGLPRFVKNILAYFLESIDPFTANIYRTMHPLTVLEEREETAKREEYKRVWYERWADEGLDFVLTVPFPTPAFEIGDQEEVTLMSVGYTFLFNLIDYSAGVMPVTNVDRAVDALPPGVAKGVYHLYDRRLEDMHGLPVGVQVVGRRLEEEKVLQGMRVAERAVADYLRECVFVYLSIPTSARRLSFQLVFQNSRSHSSFISRLSF